MNLLFEEDILECSDFLASFTLLFCLVLNMIDERTLLMEETQPRPKSFIMYCYVTYGKYSAYTTKELKDEF